MSAAPDAAGITLGLLAAGGAAGAAWRKRDGRPQVLRLARRFPGEVAAVRVAADADFDRYAAAGLWAVPAGSDAAATLAALVAACATPWLLTLPVDLFDTNDCLVRTLAACRGEDGAVAVDADGVQPRVALYRVEALRGALPAALAAGEGVEALQARLRLAAVPFAGVRFGRLPPAAGLPPLVPPR